MVTTKRDRFRAFCIATQRCCSIALRSNIALNTGTREIWRAAAGAGVERNGESSFL